MNHLDYFIHDGADAFRLKISRDLSGPAVASSDRLPSRNGFAEATGG